MTENTIDLDNHRGMAAQATDLRRLLSDVEATRKPCVFDRINWKLACLQRRLRIGAKLPRTRAIFSTFLPLPLPHKTPQTEADCRRHR
jgi:hypothetical protein